MPVEVLGISGSPIPDSNTDRAIRRILEHTGLKTRFVKLSGLSIEPCRACLGCVEGNRCVVRDDAQSLAEAFHEAPAFVIGAYTPYSSLDSRTKAFMERMYCFRHQSGGNAGKIGAAVITTACPTDNPNVPPAAEMATNQIAFWMMEEGMTNAGALVVQGNVPCIRCGHGDDCQVSGIKMLHGPDATVELVGVKRFEDDDAIEVAARDLARRIREGVLGKP